MKTTIINFLKSRKIDIIFLDRYCHRLIDNICNVFITVMHIIRKLENFTH